jgi:hypothetical protein
VHSHLVKVDHKAVWDLMHRTKRRNPECHLLTLILKKLPGCPRHPSPSPTKMPLSKSFGERFGDAKLDRLTILVLANHPVKQLRSPHNDYTLDRGSDD